MKQSMLIFFSILLIGYTFSFMIIPHIISIYGGTYLYTSSITYTNHGDRVQNIDRNLLTYSIFMNTSWQKAYLNTVSGTYIRDNDFDTNSIIVFNSSSLDVGQSLRVSYTVRLVEMIRTPPSISFPSSGTLHEIPEKLRTKYCESDGNWIFEEELKSLANSIWASQGNTTNVLRIVTSIADWIGTNVQSVFHDMPYYPLETYQSLEGDCDDQANLLIVLCRILEIPAYLQLGSLLWASNTEQYWDDSITSNLNSISYHGWAIVYVPPWGWLPFDMTLGWNPSDVFNVVKSARIWRIDTMPMFNVTGSDWAGLGQNQKDMVTSSSLSIQYDDVLSIQTFGGYLYLLMEWRLLGIITGILGISILTWQLIRFRFTASDCSLEKS